jgi:hypothetical protein
VKDAYDMIEIAAVDAANRHALNEQAKAPK